MIVVYSFCNEWSSVIKAAAVIDEFGMYGLEVVTNSPKWYVSDLNKKRTKPIKVRNIHDLMYDNSGNKKNEIIFHQQNIFEILLSNLEKYVESEIEHFAMYASPIKLVITDVPFFGQQIGEFFKAKSICFEGSFENTFFYQSNILNLIENKEVLDEQFNKIMAISKKYDYYFIHKCFLTQNLGKDSILTNKTTNYFGKNQIDFNLVSRKPTFSNPIIRDKLGIEHFFLDSVLISIEDNFFVEEENNGKFWINMTKDSISEEFKEFQFFILLPQSEIIDMMQNDHNGNGELIENFNQCEFYIYSPKKNIHFLANEKWLEYRADLINVCDVIIGDSNESLCSEILHSGKPFISVSASSTEHDYSTAKNLSNSFDVDVFEVENKMEIIMRKCVPFREITKKQFLEGDLYDLYTLVEMSIRNFKFEKIEVNGEKQIADFIWNLIGEEITPHIQIGLVTGIILLLTVTSFLIFRNRHHDKKH